MLHEQLSYNPGVIADVTGRPVRGFDYTYDDICETIRRTLDACFPPVAPLGVERIVDADGFTIQQDNWHSSIVARPFTDVPGARAYLLHKTAEMRQYGRSGGYGFPPGIIPDESDAPHPGFDPDRERARYRAYMQGLQARIGDVVIIDFTIQTGFCECWSRLGLDTFIYLYDQYPEVISDYIQTYTDCELRRLHAVADPALSPVVLIAEDFASKRGPIFSPAFLRRELFPHVRRLTAAWRAHGLKVLYHSDGNWRSVIPDLIACGVDGFYCLEPALGMDIVGAQARVARHDVGRRRGWRRTDGARYTRAGARRSAPPDHRDRRPADRRPLHRHLQRDQPAGQARELRGHDRRRRRMRPSRLREIIQPTH